MRSTDLKTARQTIARYEIGTHKIPFAVRLAIDHLTASAHIPLAGLVAAGDPIEPIPQTELAEVPSGMKGSGETFALRVKGESMRDEGILPGDLVIVRKQHTARNGQTVIAIVDNDATIKTYYRKGSTIELRPALPIRSLACPFFLFADAGRSIARNPLPDGARARR